MRNILLFLPVAIVLLLVVIIYTLIQKHSKQISLLRREKEALRKAIHQRIKNNLQIAMSLLNIQSAHSEPERFQSAIRQSRNRLYAMSLLHQRLSQTENLETIEMKRYIPELVEYIRESYAGECRILFHLHIQPIRLDVAQALPVGLIINEMVTNSIAHAFPGRGEGAIRITLEQQETGTLLRLEIADNGVGVPPGFDIRRDQSMGMQLIDTLVQQLDGTITFINREGLIIVVSFYPI